MAESKQNIIDISIHAPLRGRPKGVPREYDESEFQSTPPCGGDWFDSAVPIAEIISIHAPLRGRLR